MRIFISALFLFLFNSVTCNASWLLYQKPEFNGRLVDISTKEPIEGAVVVAIYEKHTLNPPAGSYTNAIHVKETLTNKDGHFEFPSYTAFIHPLAYSGNCLFLIYKPGYGNLGRIGIEHYLTKSAVKVWDRNAYWNKDIIFRYLPDGTIEIPRVTSTEEMKAALSNARIWSEDIEPKTVPILFSIVDKEEKLLHPSRKRVLGEQ